MRLPKFYKIQVEEAARQGHKLVSQGCALFRCTVCDQKWFLDVQPEFRDECPGLRTCPHCGRDKMAYNVTCTRSECQEAEFIANKERNRKR